MEFQYEKRFWVVFTCISARVSSKNEPDDFWPTFSTKNIHTNPQNVRNWVKNIITHTKIVIIAADQFNTWESSCIEFTFACRLSVNGFLSIQQEYFILVIKYTSLSLSPCLLCTLMMRFGLADTYIHTHTERMKEEHKKIALHSEETRFVICSFQTTKQLYRVLNFPQLCESKPQKKNTESAFEMRNSFYFHSSENNNERRKKTSFWE